MTTGLASCLGRHVLVTLITLNGLAVGASATERIPEVHGTSLTNQAVDLPEGLQGKAGVLVLGFSRGSRDGVAEWGRRLAADYRSSPTVVYYEMPVLASVPGMLRGMVVRSMKSSVPERAQARFVPITDDEKTWRALVHYREADDPYLLVVNAQGSVVWRTQGVPTDAAYAELKQQVEMLKGTLQRQ
jgi:hypothetical protein